MGTRFGRYELLRPLGRGGMAEVFLARFVGPEGFEKRLVIKRVLPALTGDRRFLRLFFDEARTQVSLSHGNLVPVFDFGRVGNAYFIAMDYVSGCDLGTLLSAGHKRGETLPPRLVAHIGIEMCRGLSYVHRRGFVHRDVSPRNVLLSTEGEVKLSDFGVALAASDAAPGLRGTLGYMAPEQARGERPDARADLFALGLVLAEALLGRRLRRSADAAEALAAARAGDSVTVEGPLAKVIARATSAAPQARYADAEAMMVALEREAATLGRVGATTARELAEKVAKWVPTCDGDGDGDAAGERATAAAQTAPTMGEETYFRDRQSASFVEEVLAQGGRRWRAWLAAGAVVMVAASLVVGGRAVQSARRAHSAAVTAPPPSPSSRSQTADRPAPRPKPRLADPQAPTPARVAAPVLKRAAAKKAAVAPATGTLMVRCTPWCVPSVDDEVRGQDGRNHRLNISAGMHRISARRLDDRQERRVEVRPDESQTIEFTFD